MKISSAGPVQLQSFTKAQSPAALQKRASSDRPISLPAPLDRPINQPAPGDITTSAVVDVPEVENYWTAERMRDAQPLPLPTIPFPLGAPVPYDTQPSRESQGFKRTA